MFGKKAHGSVGANRAAAISRLVDKVVSDYTGRQTTAQTYLDDEVITVVLRDTLTMGELRLGREGNSELVLNNRLAFQQTMRGDLIAGIERITGRKVRALPSAKETEADITTEAFVLG
jgi:uncharacterized protein YbcI